MSEGVVRMSTMLSRGIKLNVEKLNTDIALFPEVYPITPDMKLTHKGVSRLVMLDRYTYKDTEKITLTAGDFVVLTIKEDPKFPARGLGFIQEIDHVLNTATVLVEEDYRGVLEGKEAETGVVIRSLDVIEKPLEIYYEQIAKRNATGLASVEKTEEKRMVRKVLPGAC